MGFELKNESEYWLDVITPSEDSQQFSWAKQVKAEFQLNPREKKQICQHQEVEVLVVEEVLVVAVVVAVVADSAVVVAEAVVSAVVDVNQKAHPALLSVGNFLSCASFVAKDC